MWVEFQVSSWAVLNPAPASVHGWINPSAWVQVLSWAEVSSRLNVKLREILLDPLIYIHIFGNLCVFIVSICHCIYVLIDCVSKMEFGDAHVSRREHTWISKLQLWLIHQCSSKYQLIPRIFSLPDSFLGKKMIIFFIAIIRIVKWYSKQLLWVYYTF